MGALLPWMTRMMTSGVYDLQNVGFSSTSVVTSTTPLVAYRGAGRPEAAAAHRAGRRPVRRRDRHGPGRGPPGATSSPPTSSPTRPAPAPSTTAATTPGRSTSSSTPPATTSCGPSSSAGATRATPWRSASACRSTSRSPAGGPEYGEVELRPDGSVAGEDRIEPLRAGPPHRLGHARQRPARHPDGEDRGRARRHRPHPHGAVTGGSRSVQLAGAAVHDAAGELLEVARQRAADLLEAARTTSCSTATSGRFHVAGTPAVRLGSRWAPASRASTARRASRPGRGQATFPFGAHVAGGRGRRRDRPGPAAAPRRGRRRRRILNPLLAEGQVTAAWPRAWRRRCSRRSATTTTATR